MKINPPKLGQYVKLVRTGEIVKNKGFNSVTLTVDVESKAGVICVSRNEIAEITANEELEFCSKMDSQIETH
jgi:hypothetical protein